MNRIPHHDLMLDGAVIDERRDDEPDRSRPAAPVLVVLLLFRVIMVSLLSIFTFCFWPFLLVGAAIWGWPPNIPRFPQVIRYLRLIWTEKPPAPGLSLIVRLWLTVSVFRKCVVTPFWGAAWLLDEVLYGRALEKIKVVEPIIEISAGRSGSTQLARYLLEDPSLAAPSLLQFSFPYMWLWKLAPVTIGRFLTPDRVRAKLEAQMPEEFYQRHEGDPFETDTFEGALYMAHMNFLSPYLGPRVLIDEFGFAAFPPHNKDLWERYFVQIVDRIARKTLLHAGPGPDGKPRRFFVKGHFLCAGPALERQYPDARFLAMIREPVPRLRSAVNYLRANPIDLVLGSVPWAWWARALVETETTYCDIERKWFTEEGGARRCVLRFSEYVQDLEGAMKKVYVECLDNPELPDWVPREHTPRKRTDYILDRTLAEMGIDQDAVEKRLSDYIEWCRGEQRI